MKIPSEKLALLRVHLIEAREQASELIRETRSAELAQLTAHLGACVRVLDELNGDQKLW